MCIDIVKVWFEIANGQIPSFFDSCLPATCPCFSMQMISKCQWIFTKLGMCIDIVEIYGLGLLIGKFCQFLTELSACNTSVF